MVAWWHDGVGAATVVIGHRPADLAGVPQAVTMLRRMLGEDGGAAGRRGGGI
jgi:hypothetical protein